MLIYCNGQVMSLAALGARLTKPTNNGTLVTPEREPIREPRRRRTAAAPSRKGECTEIEYVFSVIQRKPYLAWYRPVPVGAYTVPAPGFNLRRWTEPYHDPANPNNRYSDSRRRYERRKNEARRSARLQHPRNA